MQKRLRYAVIAPCTAVLWLCGCGAVVPSAPRPLGPLFLVPLSIEGAEVGGAIVDTGGGYEVLLREPFGLDIVDSADVLAFGGFESVEVTEGFTYTAGGVGTEAASAIVDSSICACNGLGFHFLRKTGLVLGLDFAEPTVLFLRQLPPDGLLIPFEPGPDGLSHFDTAFIKVEVSVGGTNRSVVALLDSGATATVMRRGFVGTASALTPDRLDVTLSQRLLGSVRAGVSLFDTPGLPDLIIGTDVMREWGDQWYFYYSRTGGVVSIIPDADVGSATIANAASVRAKTAP